MTILINCVIVFFTVAVAVLGVQAFSSWVETDEDVWAVILFLKIYDCLTPEGPNPFKEFTDIPAEELADLYTVDQLRASYNNCLEHSSDSRSRKQALIHLREAWTVATIRVGLTSKPEEER